MVLFTELGGIWRESTFGKKRVGSVKIKNDPGWGWLHLRYT